MELPLKFKIMARTNTKIGDVFSVKIDDNRKKYFQLIAFDLTQLNSDVIRVFKTKYTMDETPNLSEIINGEVEFYAHCVTKWGIKLGYWEKVGNITEVGQLNHILFRDTNDYGCKVGEEPVKVSNNWHIWRINDVDFTHVGKLTGENRKAEIGVVMDAESIVNRIRTGGYDFKFYPGY
jgi:hypothetical protein